MNLHEYQAKNIFRTYDLPVPNGIVIQNIEQAFLAINKLSSPRIVVKAQIHAGGRGSAGGVKLINNNAEELTTVVKSLLNTNLVTYQTNKKGQPVNALLIEEVANIDRELYLGAAIDRAAKKIVFMASTEGGIEIEKVASSNPEKILKMAIDPLFGVLPYQCRELAFKLHLSEMQVNKFTTMVMSLGKMFTDLDLSLLEINPLAITTEGELLCLDAKFNIDDNALYRQQELRLIQDFSQDNPRELQAKKWELNYISLAGNIGCMVNGAGLAMATMDLIKLNGGEPANFLDVGGGATKERVTEAFKIILSDDKVQAVLVNIFGGIVRCDLIAEGIIEAVTAIGIKIPVIVRLEGNQALVAAKMLAESGFNITAAQSFADAAAQVVKAVGRTV